MQNPADRQSSLFMHVEVTAAMFAKNNDVIPAGLPAGAMYLGGSVDVSEAFDAATTDVIDVGDPADPNRYVAGADLKVVAYTANTLAIGYVTPDATGLVITRTPTGASTDVGKATVTFEYLIAHRSTETQS